MNDDDIICTCLGTTVRDIKAAVENGAKTVDKIKEATEAGTVCGACLDDIEALLETLITN